MITFYKYAIRELALFNASSILAGRVLLKSLNLKQRTLGNWGREIP